MKKFCTQLSANQPEFQDNKEYMLALLAQIETYQQRSQAKSALSLERFQSRGQMLPRQRLAQLLDPGGPFLELCPLAGLGLDQADLHKSVPGGGVIGGIGCIETIPCMILVSDSGIDAGALQPKGLEKVLRLQQIALENKLPYVQLVESAGANLMNYQVEHFIHGGTTFYNLAKLSAQGLPVITVTHGSSTAGGAYQTGLSDYIIMVRDRTRAFLAGPPLLKAATGEIAHEEELGGAKMHCYTSGLGDFLAENDGEAIVMARKIVKQVGAHFTHTPNTKSYQPPPYDVDDLLGIMPIDYKRPVDMLEVIARLVDADSIMPFAENYGAETLCIFAHLEAWPIGIITNNGPIDSEGANKATHFIQACCQSSIPIIYLNNTTGFLVGKQVEQQGIIKHGSKMIQAVTNAQVPQITLYCGASFGAGNYGMCGRGFSPRFCFSWPNAKTAVMGGQQAAQTMAMVTSMSYQRRGLELPKEQIDALQAKIIQQFEHQMPSWYTSARLLDDGVIDPRDTRSVLAYTLALCREADQRQLTGMQFAVARP
ncbi:MAG: carboxyl transferase domain-containing protein [Gammaproteobacteria bacterium]|nr:carboxyl transferase domain-containing protein [Gammaproteobacteria bacterium]